MSSSCCGAPVYEETDMCSACKEYCDDLELFCPDCDWEGMIKDCEMDAENDSEQYWVNRYCPNCNKKNLEDIK